MRLLWRSGHPERPEAIEGVPTTPPRAQAALHTAQQGPAACQGINGKGPADARACRRLRRGVGHVKERPSFSVIALAFRIPCSLSVSSLPLRGAVILMWVQLEYCISRGLPQRMCPFIR